MSSNSYCRFTGKAAVKYIYQKMIGIEFYEKSFGTFKNV